MNIISPQREMLNMSNCDHLAVCSQSVNDLDLSVNFTRLTRPISNQTHKILIYSLFCLYQYQTRTHKVPLRSTGCTIDKIGPT